MKSLLEEKKIGTVLPALHVLRIRDLILLEFGQVASSPGFSGDERFLEVFLLYELSFKSLPVLLLESSVIFAKGRSRTTIPQFNCQATENAGMLLGVSPALHT